MLEEQLILDNVNLVYFVLKQMHLYKEIEEWFDIGVIGLIKGIRNYNSNYGMSLSTYVCRCIRNEILQEIRKSKADKRVTNLNCISLNQEIFNNGKDEPITMGNLIPSKYNLEDEIIKKDILENLLKGLTKKEKYILIHSYGLFGNKELTQIEISKKLNLSQAQICRILKQAIQKIRNRFEVGTCGFKR